MKHDLLWGSKIRGLEESGRMPKLNLDLMTSPIVYKKPTYIWRNLI
jgi:hypothetical protein